jgi:apolipoprotein N-acyltransferase
MIAGWSSPGIDQGWLAWIALAPLFFACSRVTTAREAGLLGTAFGTAFNLVYLQWYLQVRATAWTAVFSLAPSASSIVVWVAMSVLQGSFIGLVCYLLHWVPLSAGWLPSRRRLPLYVVAPLLWVGVIEKICNFRGLLGVPWSMLEYTQYKAPALLQITSLIGGSGLACAIVLCNVVIASLVASAFKSGRFAFESTKAAVVNSAIAALLLLGIPMFGEARLAAARAEHPPTISVAALQGNLAATTHGVPVTKSIQRGLQLALGTKADICVWPEWSVPIDWSTQKDFVRFFAHEAQLNKQAWVLGTFDTAGATRSREFNSVGVVRADGSVEEQVYHKQYLVPFGEYVPDWLYYSPLMSLLDPKKEAQRGIMSDNHPTVLDAGTAKLGPLICFENCMPDLAASTVRSGAQILVDCSNTTWFNYSGTLGKQLIAFSVLRAAENHRSFVFCTLLGPSAIIDANGRILKQAGVNQAVALEAEVQLESDLTPFTRFCSF